MDFKRFFLVIVLFSTSLFSTDYVWSFDGDANWNSSLRWIPALTGFPNSSSDTATMGTVITAAREITLGQNITVATVTFSSPYVYTIASGNTLILNSAAGTPLLESTSSGNVDIDCTVSLSENSNMEVSGSGDLRIYGVVSGSSRRITKLGSGTLVLAASNTYSGGTYLNAGMLRIYENSLGTGTLTFNGGILNPHHTLSCSNNMACSSTGNIRVYTGTTFTVSGVISGSGGLEKQNPGTLILNGSNSYSGGTTIDDGTLQVSSDNNLGTGSITFNAATLYATNTFSSSKAISITSAATINVISSKTLTLSGVISGGGGTLTKTGDGYIVLSGTSANTYTGLTTVSAGYLSLNKTAGVNAIAGNVTIDGGSFYHLSSNQIANTSAITLNSGVFNTNGFSETISSFTYNAGEFYSSQALSLASTGTALTMRDVTISFPINLTGGSGGSVVFDATNNGTATMSGALNLGGVSRTFTIANGSAAIDMNLSGVVSNGGIAKAGDGTLVLSGSNTYSSGTAFNAGVVQITQDNNLGTGNLSFNGGALQTDGTFSTSKTVTLTGAGTLNVNSGTLTLNGVISNAGSLTKTGSGTLVLAGSNSYSGGTNFNGGTVSISANNNLGTGNLTFDGGTLQTDGTFSSTKTVTLTGDGTVNVNSGTLSLNGVISDAGSLTKTGSGTLELGGSNTYSGGTNFNAGVVSVSASDNLGTGNFTFDGGTLHATDNVTSSKAISITSSATVSSDTTKTLILSGVISGAGGTLTKIGAGIVALAGTGANTYTGLTTVSEGTLSLSKLGGVNAIAGNVTIDGGGLAINGLDAIADTSTVIIESGYLNNNGYAETISSLTINGGNCYGIGGSAEFLLTTTGTALTMRNANNTCPITLTGGSGGGIVFDATNNGTATISGDIDLGGIARTFTIANGSADIDMNISGIISNGEITKEGEGTLVLGGSNTYAGGTNFNTGVVSVSADNNLGTGNLTFDGGTLHATSTFFTLKAASIISSATVSAAIGTDFSLSGVISGAGGTLTKIGEGTVVLNGLGANTYTGLTTVSEGELILNKTGVNAIAGNVNINGGSCSLFASNQIADTSSVTVNSGEFFLEIGIVETISNLTINADRCDGYPSSELSLTSTGTALTMRNAINTCPITLTGGSGGGIVFDATNNGTATISGDIDLGGITRTFTIANGSATNDMVISSILSNGGVTKTGAGTLELSGSSANTYTGLTTVTAGTLSLNKTSVNAIAGNVSVNGGTLFLNAANQIIDTSSVTIDSGSFDNNGNAETIVDLTVNGGTCSGAGEISLTSTGTALTMRDTSVSCPISLTGGSGGNIVFDATNDGTATISGNIALGGIERTFAIANGSATVDMSVSGIINSGGALKKTGDGTLSLSGINTYTAGTTIEAGIIVISSNSNLGNSLGDLTFTGGTLQISSSLSSTRDIYLTGVGTINTDAAVTSTFSGVIDGASLFTKSGDGTLTITGTNTYSGGVTVAAGTLVGTTNSLIGNITNNSVLSFDQSFTGTYTSSIGGTGSVIKSGSGVVTFAIANNYAGGTSFNAGTLSISTSDNRLGTGNLTFNGGTLRTSGTFSSSKTLTLTGAGTVEVSSDTLTLTGLLSGGGLFTKAGSGTLVLTNSNTYSGGTTFNAGTTQISQADNLGVGGTLTFNGATLQTTENITISRGITLTGAGTISPDALKTTTLSGVITGAGSFTKISAGTLILSGANTYLGGTILSLGTTQISQDNNLGTGNLTFNGGTLQITSSLSSTRSVAFAGAGTIETDTATTSTFSGVISGGGLFTKTGAGSLTITGNNTYSGGVTVTAGTLIGDTNSLKGNITNNAALIFDHSFDGTYAGSIGGTGTVTKTGSGSLYLSGANAYSGDTTVTNGKLSVTGSIVSDVAVASSAELGGTGTISGNISNFGTIRPGDSIGTLTVVGDVVFNSGSTFEVELNPIACDLLDVTGSVTINPGATIEIVPDKGMGSYSASTSFLVIQTTTGVTGTFSNVVIAATPFNAEIVYDDPNQVSILVLFNDFNELVQGGNPGTVASYFDTIGPFQDGTDIDNVVEEMQFLDANGMRDVFDMLHPALYKGMILSQENNSFQIGSIISNRCRKICKNICENNSAIDVWIDNFGDFYIQGGYKSFYTKSLGIVTGADFTVGKNNRIGTFLGYSYSYLRWDKSGGNADINSCYTGVYFSFCNKKFFINSSCIGAFNHYNGNRKIDITTIHRTAKTKHIGAETFSKIEIGSIKKIDSLKILPFISFDILYLFEEKFKEKGAISLNLKVREKHYLTYRSEMGFHLKKCEEKKFSPFAKFSWVKEIRPFGKGYKARLRGYEQKFEVQGKYPNRDLFSTYLGIAKKFAKRRGQCSLQYQGEFGNHYVDNGVNITASYGF